MANPRRYRLPRPVIDSACIFLFACVLIFPLFRLEYLDNWGSIESTFIGDARMLGENLPHPGWQPLWYCGTRFDYIYPPALRYGTALISVAGRMSTARAYHLYTGFLYALGIAGIYWLAYTGSRSRAQGWLAAGLVALFSPALLLMSNLRHDSPDWVPQRLHVLMSYGEGPHISALSLLGFALAASFVALRQWRPIALAGAGVLCAVVVSNNFYGATALAIFFPILVWAVWLETRRLDVWVRAAAIAALAYGLCAFWLTPSYLKITQHNLRWVAPPAKTSSIVIAILCAAAFVGLTFIFVKKRDGVAWPVFAGGAAFFTALYVLGWYYAHVSVAGDAFRLAPEMDLALILLVVFCISVAWKRRMLRSAIVLLLLELLIPTSRYVRRAWTIFPRAQTFQSRCEYNVTKWMHDQMPTARALSSGSIRFWYDAWFDNTEAHGGSDQGMLNQILPIANWQITQGTEAQVAVAWLQALGVDAVIVPSKTSAEVYHDYAYPEKFQGALSALYEYQGVMVYRVPRRYPAIARVVERQAITSLGPPVGGDDIATLSRYLSVVEHGPDAPVALKWKGFESADLNANVSDGQAVLFQETFDPYWHATSEGKNLAIDRDPMGFMLIHAPAGVHTIQMHFDTPLENRIGWVLTGLTCVVIVGLCFFTRWRGTFAA